MRRPPEARAPLWMRIVVGLVALTALAGLALSASVFVARGMVESRLERLGQKTDRDIQLGALDLSLTEGLAVRHLWMTRPGSDDVQLSVAALETDLHLLELIGGRRRPERVELRGLEAELAVDAQGVNGFDDLLDALSGAREESESGGAGPASVGRPVALTISQSKLLVQATLPAIGRREVLIDGIEATGKVGPGRRVHLEGEARVVVGGIARRATLAVNTAAGELSLTLDRPLRLPIEWRGRRMLVGLRGIRRVALEGVTALTDVTVRTWRERLTVREVVARDGGGSLRPELASLSSIELKELELHRGGQLLRAQALKLQVEPRGEELPRLVSASGTGLLASLPGREIHAELGGVDVTFAADPIDALRRGDLAAAVRALRLRSPTLRLPSPDRVLADLTGLALAGKSGAARPERSGAPAAPLGGSRAKLMRLLRAVELEVEDGLVSVTDAAGQHMLTLNNVALKLRSRPGDKLAVDLDAALVRADEPTGIIRLETLLDPQGMPESATGVMSGKDFAHVLSRFSEYVTVPPDAGLDVRFEYAAPAVAEPPGMHRVKVRADFKDFGFQSWRISHAPVKGLEGEALFQLALDLKRRHFEVELERLRIGKATLKGHFAMTRPRHAGMKLSARLEMPRQDCSDVARSIPPVMIPRLEGLVARGDMEFTATLNIDMDDPNKAKLRVTGDVESCRIVSLGKHIDLGELRGRSYVHHPHEPNRGRRTDISVGPGTVQWVQSHHLPRFVKAAALVTEDRGYKSHRGIRWTLVNRALRLNLRKRRFVYGGSTITQQLVKNLYLTREKTLTRKLEEAIIAMQMERTLTKDEILTLYVNVVEYGPDIYGVKHAARFYFGKHPRDLSPLEAAFIMGWKPYPPYMHRQWKKGRVSEWWVRRLKKVLSMMHSRENAITKEEVEAAAPYQPRFRRPEESFKSGASRAYRAPERVEPDVDW